jgi:hypothetical protein
MAFFGNPKYKKKQFKCTCYTSPFLDKSGSPIVCAFHLGTKV